MADFDHRVIELVETHRLIGLFCLERRDHREPLALGDIHRRIQRHCVVSRPANHHGLRSRLCAAFRRVRRNARIHREVHRCVRPLRPHAHGLYLFSLTGEDIRLGDRPAARQRSQGVRAIVLVQHRELMLAVGLVFRDILQLELIHAPEGLVVCVVFVQRS